MNEQKETPSGSGRPPLRALLLFGVGAAALVLFYSAARTGGKTETPGAPEKQAPTESPLSEVENAGPTEAAPAPEKRIGAEQPEPPSDAKASSTCQSDADCRGPHSADCEKWSCTDGGCVGEFSSCECQKNPDCDDGDRCTRDLCFARTKKCIHMPQECN